MSQSCKCKRRICCMNHTTTSSSKFDPVPTQQQISNSSFAKWNCLVRILYIAILCVGFTNALSIERILQTDSYSQKQPCWDNLNISDVDKDGFIDQNEYVQFAILVSPVGLIDEVADYNDLPLAYKLAFLTTSCLCNNQDYGGDPNDTDCCIEQNRIRIPTAPNDSPLSTDTAYLYAVCSLTNAASDTILRSPTPTSLPTDSPIFASSSAPTKTPSMAPTPQPTSAKSYVPTVSPSFSPTNLPKTDQPSTSTPTAEVSNIPTSSAPTVAPPVSSSSLSPTAAIFEGNATVTYNISIKDGTSQLLDTSFVTDYLSNLISGLNRVAEAVANESLTGPDNRRRLRHQFNAVGSLIMKRMMQGSRFSLKSPAIIQNVIDIECPGGALIPAGTTQQDEEITLGTNEVCQEVTAVVTLTSNSSVASIEAAAAQFGSDLYNAIYDGDLQDELNKIYLSQNSSTNTVVVLTGYVRAEDAIIGNATPNAAPVVPSSTLSPGAISAITLGAVAVALVPIALFLSNRTRYDDEEQKPADYQEYQPDNGDLDDMDSGGGPRGLVLPDGSVAGSQYTDFAVKSTSSQGGGVGATTLGAAQTDYGKAGHSSKKVIETMMLDESDDIVAEPGMPENDSSSNAGSSGWSSSAGISSLNTGSIDDSTDIAAAAGATLAGISLASSTFRRQQQKAAAVSKSDIDTDDDSLTEEERKDREFGVGEGMESSSSPAVTRDQLDNLIESGDWAAVGATAALLAAASDSQSATTGQSRTSNSASGGSRGSASVDAARAAELDHLVDAGDWEGVVLAAAKFEAAAETQSGSISKGSHSRTNSSQGSVSDAQDSGTGTGTFTGTFDPSLSTSRSDDPARAAKLAEYRSEVEALVRRVVPEEIDNVDEMMNQFKGREEELVETLRTMQERAVAQKARQAGQKNAKLEARRNVQRGVVPGADAVAQRIANTDNNDNEANNERTTESNTGAHTEITVGGIGTSSQENFSAVRRQTLEVAIEANDWRAVSAAAAAISDTSAATSITSGEIDRLASQNMSTTSSEGSGSSRKRQIQGVNADRAAELDAIIDAGDWNAVVSVANRFTQEDKKQTTSFSSGKISKEEEDALREAELWMKIAEQKKAEGANDIGASDAAEWAIQRSLSQLRDAEKKQKRDSKKDKFQGEEV